MKWFHTQIKFGYALIATLLSMSSGTLFASADPVESDNPETLIAHQEVLKSVFSLSLEHGWCTGTLVAPRIILTARHCAVGHYNDLLDLLPGDRLDINLTHHFRIVKTRIQPKISKNGKNTDLALLLVEPETAADEAVFEGVSFLPIAQHEDADLSSEILVAGYGMNDWFSHYHDEQGVLHAGTNMPVINAYQKPFLPNRVQSELEKLINRNSGLAEELAITAKRMARWSFTIHEGSAMTASKAFFFKMVGVDGKRAIFQSGDSGSAAVAYTSDGRAQIVGVANSGIFDLDRNPMVMYAEDVNGRKTAEISVPYIYLDIKLNHPLLKNGLEALKKDLISRRWVDAQGLAQQKYKIVLKREIHEAAIYTSVLNPMNQRFLQKNLALLGDIRDLKAIKAFTDLH